MKDRHPWGKSEVLAEAADHAVRRVTIDPGAGLAAERHHRRAEHWHFVAGEAVVTVDGQEVRLGPGDSVNIHCGAAHRVRNPGPAPVVFIEVRRGETPGEDDVETLLRPGTD